MKYGILCILLPDNDGVSKERMHGPIFDTIEERDQEHRTLRHQNLPFSMKLVSIDIEP